MDPILTKDAAAQRVDYLSSLPLAKLKQEQEKEKAAGSYTPQTRGLYEALASEKLDNLSAQLSALPSKQIAFEFERGLADGEYDEGLAPVAQELFNTKFKEERGKSGLEKTGSFLSSAASMVGNELAAPFTERDSQIVKPFVKGVAKSARDLAVGSNYFALGNLGSGVPVEDQRKATNRLLSGAEFGTRQTADLVRDIFDDQADEEFKAKGDQSLGDIFKARRAEQRSLVDAARGAGTLVTGDGRSAPAQMDAQDLADIQEMSQGLDATNLVPFGGGFKLGASGVSRVLQGVAKKVGIESVERGIAAAAKVADKVLETGPRRQVLGTPLMTAEEALIRQAKTDGLLRKARLAAGKGTVALGDGIQNIVKALPAAGTTGVAAAGLTLASGGDAQEALTAGLSTLVGRKILGSRAGMTGVGKGLQLAGRAIQKDLPTPFSKTQAAINAFRYEYRPVKTALTAAGLGAVETGLLSLGADSPEEAGSIVGGGATLGAAGSALGTLQAVGRDQLVKKAAGVTGDTSGAVVDVPPLGLDPVADKINAEALKQLTPAGSVFLQTARAMLPDQHVYVAMTGDQAQSIYTRLTGDQTDVRNVNGVTVPTKDGKQLVIIRPAGVTPGITGEAGGHEVTHALKNIALADPKTRGAWLAVEEEARKALGPEGSEVFEGVKQQYLDQMPPGSTMTEQQVVDEFIAEHGSVILSGLPAGKLGGNRNVAQTLTSALFRLAENAGLRKVGFARDGSDPVTSSTLPYTPSFNLLDSLEYAINASRLEASDLVPDNSVPPAAPTPAAPAVPPATSTPAAPAPVVAPTASTFSGGPGVLNPIPTGLATDRSLGTTTPPQQPTVETPAPEAPVVAPAVEATPLASTETAPAIDKSVNGAIRGQEVQAARTNSESPLSSVEEKQMQDAQPDKAKQPVARKVWESVKALGGQRIGLPIFEAAINQDGVVRSKRVAPYAIEVSSGGKVTAIAVDMDRANYNAKLLFDWAAEKGTPNRFGYEGINDPKFVADLGTYLRNQAEGRRGSGETLTAEGVGPSTGSPVAKLSREQEQFFNVLMGQTPPKELTTRSAAAIARIRATAKASGIDVIKTDGGSVEPNALRDALRKEGAPIERIGEDPDPTRRQSNPKDRNSVIARIRLQDFESLNPTGQSTSQPNIRAIEASFMPGAPRREATEWVDTAALKAKSGKIYTGAAHWQALEKAEVAGEPLKGLVDGFLTNKGRFLDREASYKLAADSGQLDEAAYFKSQRDYAEEDGRTLKESVKKLETFTFDDARAPGSPGAQFMPSAAGQPTPQEPAKIRASNEDVKRISKKYVDQAGLPYQPHEKAVPVREETAKRIADFYDKAVDSPNDPQVKAAYTALADEVVEQWKQFEDAGYTAELWTGEGQPYADSAAMMKDVRDNKHIYYFGTEGGFGLGGITPEMRSNPMLAESGVNFEGASNVPVNDVFRVVHDIIGHGAHGYEFGPKGEFNAYLEHSRMFSDAAKPALAAETLAQNSWVNFGPHLRNSDGSLPKKGDANFIPAAERRFADQKNIIIPDKILKEVDAYARESTKPATPDSIEEQSIKASEAAELAAKKISLLPSKDSERIVRAAVRFGDEIRKGSSHVSILLDAVDEGLVEEKGFGNFVGDYEDGFVTASGKFLNREEAFEQAGKSGQLDEDAVDELSNPDGSGSLESITLNESGRRISEGASPAAFMPSLANAKAKGKDVQFKREKPIKGAVGGVLDIVHFSSKDLTQIDPAKSFGKGAATQTDLKGAPKAFFYAKGTAYEAPIAGRSNVYTAKVDGNSIYDLNTDVLNVQSIVNREKRDQAIENAGFKGFYAETPGFDAVAIYDKIDVTPALRQDVMTPKQLKNLGLQAQEAPDAGEAARAAITSSPAYEKARQRIAKEVGSSSNGAFFDAVDAWVDGRLAQPAFMPANNDAGRISTRNPSGLKATENALTDDLVADIATMKKTPELLRTNAKLIAKYPALRLSTVSPDKILAELKSLAESNLNYLHDNTPQVIRDRSKLWYVGGRKLAEDMATQYKSTPEGAAGVLAALSPQKDWYMNVDLADRVYKNLGELQGSKVQKNHVTWLADKLAGDTPSNATKRALLEGLEGADFSELPRLQQAMVLRANDELNHARSYRLVTPEGEKGDFVRSNSGNEAKVAWGDFGSIAKAVGIANDPSREVISNSLGLQHKVRNFFNNIAYPDSDKGDVTIDTHAVAAALLSPLSGSSTEVLHNFGGGGAAGSSLTGISGTYPIYADAYRDAAKKLGLLPRELQSITWEAVRGLFPDTFKTSENATKIANIWKRHAAGELSVADAQAQIAELSGGIRHPSWYAAR